MSSELLSAAAPDFRDPLGLLRACHQRIEKQLQTLEKAEVHIREKGLDAEARKALGAVFRYFSTAGQHHHQDEEQDLFPRLARQSLKLADVVHRLRRDHKAMEAAWQELAPLLENPTTITEDPERFAASIATMAERYRKHIIVEEADLLDIAQHIFSSDELREIGSAMAERRGMQPQL